MRPWQKSKRKWCWAAQLPAKHDRLADAVERVREKFFSAQVLIALPDGELLVAEVVEHGRRLHVCGKSRRVTVAPATFWKLVEAVRKASG